MGASSSPTKVRNLTVKDDTGSIKIALWQDKTKSPVKTGQKVRLTHMKKKYDTYFSDMTLMSTPDWQIEVIVNH